MNNVDINIFELQTRTIADPAVGTDFTITPNVGERIEVLAVTFLFTADANSANRSVHLHLVTATNHSQGATAPGVITANEAIDLDFTVGMQPQDLSATIAAMTVPFPSGFFLQSGDTLESVVSNIQVGDQISDVVYRCKGWFTL